MRYEPQTEHPDVMTVEGYPCACQILGWETEPDADTVWTGYGVRTGYLVAVMVGDDHQFTVDPEEDTLTAIPEGGYCRECGQLGCGWCVS